MDLQGCHLGLLFPDGVPSWHDDSTEWLDVVPTVLLFSPKAFSTALFPAPPPTFLDDQNVFNLKCDTYLYPLSVGIFSGSPPVLRVIQAWAFWRPVDTILGRSYDLIRMNLSWFHAQSFHAFEIWRGKKWPSVIKTQGIQDASFFRLADWKCSFCIHTRFYERWHSTIHALSWQ